MPRLHKNTGKKTPKKNKGNFEKEKLLDVYFTFGKISFKNSNDNKKYRKNASSQVHR